MIDAARIAALLPCLLVAASSFAVAETPPDPWVGKERGSLEGQIGAPDRFKRAKDGGQSWTYKLRRLEDGEPPQAGATLVNIPGVGICQRVGPPPTSSPPQGLMEPTELDEQGRRTSGGVSSKPSQQASASWSTGEGFQTTRSDQPPPRGPKVKLRFELDPSGTVVSWSVSPKP